ncbi:hypothetical protein [Pararhizobium sp. DWP1-1-3]|uniref:hypothetical protein n=1 Tax=Pararhizobium sp. DWP1-1-3 TaxID=2804652 RepID=UPI003CE76622
MINAAPFNRFDRNSKPQRGKGEIFAQDLNIQRGEFANSENRPARRQIKSTP